MNCIIKYWQFALMTALIWSSVVCIVEGQSTFEVEYNPTRGFYTSTQSVSLTTDLQNATIRYTLDGGAPTTTSGNYYTGPIAVSSTSVIRAIAYTGNTETPVATHTYIFAGQVANQFGTPSGYPTHWQDGFLADYDMDPEVVNDPTYGPQIQSALLSLPTMSLVMNPDHLFNPSTGIYTNSEESGVAWERAASIELIDPAGVEEFQENCGVRIHGGSSRRPEVSPKHSFRLLFKSDYGNTKLRYPLFGPDATDKFDTFILRAGTHFTLIDSYHFRRNNPQKIKDEFFRQLQLAMGHVSSHGRFVHLYINGLYWGLYNPAERPSAPFLSEYFGGNKSDYDAINSGEAIDGDDFAWDNLFSIVNFGLSTNAQYDVLKTHVDVENFIDYMIINHYGRNTDWDYHNWYAGKKRTSDGRWRFFSWDAEFAFGFHEYETSVFNRNNNSAPSRIFQKLQSNPEFLVDFGDRVECHCFNDGILEENNAKNLYQTIHNDMIGGWVPESARWGDYRRDVYGSSSPLELVTLHGHYLPEYNDLMNNVFPTRTSDLITLYKSNDLYSLLNPVQFSQLGGGVPANYQLTLSNNNGGGIIYYTNDGSDPRAVGGGVSSTAIQYTGPITIVGTMTIRARTKASTTNEWSSACPRTFYAPQDFSGLVINEINYHPGVTCTGGLDDEEYEFIELKNGGTTTIDLTDLYFTDGITYKFPKGTSLIPGGFIVLAGDAVQFQAKYGFAPFGQYLGKLNNGGEQIILANALGTTIDVVYYDDESPWPIAADGQGPSLELSDTSLDNALASSWDASIPNCGTPNQENSNPCALNPGALVLNEIHYNSIGSLNSGDWVEVYNPTSSTIDLSGWIIQDGSNNFVIPGGKSIPPNGYFVFVENDALFGLIYPDVTNFVGNLGFGFGNLGEYIKLLSPQGCLVDIVNYNVESPWPSSPSGGGPTLSLNSTGADNSIPSNWSGSSNHGGTPGASNQNLCTGNTPTIVINEINYNSYVANNPGNWIELYNPTANSIDLSDWEFHDGGNFFTIPTGTNLNAGSFLILTEDQVAFSSIFPNVPNYLGNLGFGLSNLGERVAIYNENRCLIDVLIYDELAPWPTAPNGTGSTLSLTNPALNNGLAGSWDSSSEINAPYGTPGRANEECPTIQIQSAPSICVNQTTTLSASQNINGATYNWSVQGGTPTIGTGNSINTIWNSAGTFIATLTVNYYECSYVIQKNITVNSCNISPVASNDYITIPEDGIATQNVLTNDSDEDYYSILTTTAISSPTNGTLLSISANGNYSYQPALNFNGTDNFIYEVCDDGNPVLCSQATVTITIDPVNDNPVVTNNSGSTQEENSLILNVLNDDSDVDGNIVPSSVSVSNLPPASQGTVTVNVNGTIEFSPATNFNGTVTPFQYTVCDNGTPLPSECGTATINITVSAINDQPIANSDIVNTNEDQTATENVKTNDSDIENDLLTVNTNPASPPDNGSVVLQSDGSFTYTPNPNFNGTDDFVYEICDNGSPVLCSQATVTINVAAINDAPVVNNDNASTSEDNATTINILNNDNDIDGNLNLNTLTLNSVPPLSQGVPTINGDGSITFTPAANFSGNVDPFSYTICDTGTPSPPLCNTATIYITVTSTNDPPSSNIDMVTTSEDVVVAGNVLINDSDLDGDNLSVNTTPITSPANGSVFISSDGSFTYTPNPNFNGSDEFVYEVCDDGSPSLCDQNSVNIQIYAINDAPSLQVDNVTTDEDQSILIQVLSNDNDIDGSFDLATLSVSSEPPPSQGIITVNADGSLTFTPNENYYGNVDAFYYTICDNGTPLPATCATETVNIVVNSVNDAPVALFDAKTIQEDAVAIGNLLDNDIDLDNNNLSAVVVSNPVNGTLILQTSGEFTYTPNSDYYGSDSFVYDACDDGTPVLCDQGYVFIDVLPVNDPPSTVDDTISTNEDLPITFAILSNDLDVDGNLDSNSLTLNNVPPVSQGIMVLNANRTVTFTPAMNYYGPVDPVIYAICDDGYPLPLKCNQAIINLEVLPVNDPPTALDDTNVTNEDIPVTGNLLVNDIDAIDGNNLMATLTPVSTPDNGVVIIGSDGTYTYTPGLNFNGSDSFEYEVCDDGIPSICDQATVSIIVFAVNDAPSTIADNLSTLEEIDLVFDPLINDVDIDGNLDFPTLTLLSFPPANQGQATLNNDGTITFVPLVDFFGAVDPFEYEICDDGMPLPGLCSTEQINIVVNNVNDAPIAITDSLITQEDLTLNGNLLVNDSDKENNGLILNTTPVSNPSNGMVSLSSNGDFVYTPDTDYFGEDSFSYEVCDDGSPIECDQAIVVITITSCPDASIIVPTILCAGGPLLFQAVDQGAGAVYQWDFGQTATPETVVGSSALVQYNVAGSQTVQLTITQDGCVSIDTETITLLNGGFYPDAGQDVTICPEESVQIGGSPTGPIGASYLWIPNIGLNSNTVSNPIAFPETTTTYTIEATFGSCIFSDQVVVEVDTSSVPFADAGPDLVNCGAGIQIGGAPAGIAGSTFSWSPSFGLSDPSSPNPLANHIANQTYTLTVSKNGCSKTDEVTVQRFFPPNIDGGVSQTICQNPDQQGVILGGYVNFPGPSYQWSPVDGLSHPTEGNTFANPSVTTTYYLMANTDGCTSIDSTTVTVDICNTPPVTVQDIDTTLLNTNVTGNVLDNDYDPDGDIIVMNLVPFGLPGYGVVAFESNGDYLYSPNLGFVGTDYVAYEICDDGIPQFCTQGVLKVEVLEPECIDVQVALYLEGPFDEGSNMMKTTLNTVRGVLPGQTPNNPFVQPTPPGQPYHVAPWYYNGTEGAIFTDADYTEDIVDWVLVSFRASEFKNTEVLRTAALLRNDGVLVFPDSCFMPTPQDGPFYVVIEHRNHIGIMSSQAVDIIDYTLSYDFRNKDSYRNSTTYGQKQRMPGVYCMIGGDGDQASDFPSYDITGDDKIIFSIENGGFDLYLPSDFSLDGDVNGVDKIIWTINNGAHSSVPK